MCSPLNVEFLSFGLLCLEKIHGAIFHGSICSLIPVRPTEVGKFESRDAERNTKNSLPTANTAVDAQRFKLPNATAMIWKRNLSLSQSRNSPENRRLETRLASWAFARHFKSKNPTTTFTHTRSGSPNGPTEKAGERLEAFLATNTATKKRFVWRSRPGRMASTRQNVRSNLVSHGFAEIAWIY